MDEELDIIVTGFDVDLRQAESGLMNVFGLDAVRARRFVRAVPIVAKRCGNRASADRYVQALRSIGARVEAQPAAADGDGPLDARALNSSLPIPAPSVMARLHESARVERETLRAIRRFRAAEGLEPDDDSPLPLDLDPSNPDIPRAPKVPHDLDRMPNAKLPRFSDRPEWMLTDPLVQGEGSGPDAARTSRPHADARLPPPPSPVPRAGTASGSAKPGNAQAAPEPRGRGESVRPSAVGLAHAATASVRPGIGLLSWWQRLDHDARPRRLREYWPAAVAVALVGATALWYSGALETEAGRRERAWRAQGIDPGEYADAALWLDSPDHELGGLAKGNARELVEGLSRAGARGVYAVWIRKQGQGERAAGLVIELPPQAAERRTILWHVARARGRNELEPDDGGRYYLLTFE